MSEETTELKVIDKREFNGEQQEREIVEETSLAVVQAAIMKGHDPAFIEKMMNLQERYESNEARKAFFEALANFKAEAPPVSKDKYNKHFDSWYTSLGNLLDTYNPVLGKHGLSISHPTPSQTDKSMTVECKLSHRMGYSESVSMTAPIDQAAIGKQSGKRSRNPIQDIKSTFTYLRSATCEAVLGVAGTEGTTDDNGNSAGGGTEYIDDKEKSQIVDFINSKNVDEKQFLEYMGAENIDAIPKSDFQKAINALKVAKGRDREPGEDDEK